jgi:hypothetical protein
MKFGSHQRYSFSGPKFPVYEHPTPVNVAVRPADAAPSNAGRSLLSSLAAPTGTASRPVAAADANGQRPNGAAAPVTAAGAGINPSAAATASAQAAGAAPANGANNAAAGQSGGCCIIS